MIKVPVRGKKGSFLGLADLSRPQILPVLAG